MREVAPRGVDVHTLRRTTAFAAKPKSASYPEGQHKKKLSSTNLIINFQHFHHHTARQAMPVFPLARAGKFSLYSINFHNAVMHFSAAVARVSHFDGRTAAAAAANFYNAAL